MQTDEELVQSVLAGHREGFAHLVQRYEASVLAAALGILGELEAARDASQEAFVIAYRKLASLRQSGQFRPWVLRIAQRQALAQLRQRKQAALLGRLAAEASSPAGGAAKAEPDPVQLAEEQEALLRVVLKLPDQERTAVMMRYFDDLTLQEIATSTGLSVGTVSKQLTRAHQRLREMMGGRT